MATPPAGVPGAARGARLAPPPPAVELTVDRLDHVASVDGVRILRASGRAWAPAPVMLGPALLVVGAAHVPGAPDAAGVRAGPDAPGWLAEFRVPEEQAAAATEWAVETALPRPPEPTATELSAGLQRALLALRELDGMTLALEGRVGTVTSRVDALRAADARRLAAVEAARRQAERRLDAVAIERDAARRRAAELAAELDAIRGRWSGAGFEVEQLRAALDVAGSERDAALRRLEEAIEERDALRDQLEALLDDAEGRLGPPLPAPVPLRPHLPAVPPWSTDAPEIGEPPAPRPLAVVPVEPAASPEHPPAFDPPTALRPSPEPEALGPPDDPAVAPPGHDATGAPATPAGPPRRRHPAGSFGIGALAVAGTLLVADAAVTLAWQEPVSALLASRQQSQLADQLREVDVRLQAAAPAPAPRQTPEQRMAQLAITQRSDAKAGDALGRLQIPSIGGSWVVVQGTSATQLRKGPGHYGTSSLPGRPGTTAIAGHRTTFGAPFRRIDELDPGDRIVVRMPYGRFTYRVEGTRIVAPEDVGVLRAVGSPRLVLTACHPLYSAEQRIVVFARLSSSTPLGPARRA